MGVLGQFMALLFKSFTASLGYGNADNACFLQRVPLALARQLRIP